MRKVNYKVGVTPEWLLAAFSLGSERDHTTIGAKIICSRASLEERI